MWGIGWKMIALGLIALLDLIVFADLVRAELGHARARRGVTKYGRSCAAEYRRLLVGVMDHGRTAASSKGLRR